MRRAAPAVVALGVALLLAGCGGRSTSPTTSTGAQPAPGPTAPPPTAPSTTSPATPSTTPSTTTPAPTTAAPSPVMSFEQAGAFVWHETDISPEELGRELRKNGFGWVAVFVQDGTTEDPVEGDWIARFRAASGLSVGGWGALRAQPVREARLASSIVARDGLDFYVADAEAEYSYSGPDGPSPERFARSRLFTSEFRRLDPSLPAAVSSYCRPDQHDLDWHAWSSAGFAFLPQAYVNDFGVAASPAACVRAAAPFFGASNVHPTIGMYPGVARSLDAASYVPLLARARTLGFSVYLAETRMTPGAWRTLGQAIRTRGIAAPR